MPRLLPKVEKADISPLKYPLGSQVSSAINGEGGKRLCQDLGESFDAKGSSTLQRRCQASLNVTALFIFISFVGFFL